MLEAIHPGLSFTFEKVAEPKDSAAAMGSGGLEVFSTPCLVALFENAAKQLSDALLPEGCSTVGVEVQVKHLKATPIGLKVRCTATVTAVEGKRIIFTGEMWDERGRIGEGQHTRFVINNAEFMKRLG